MSISDYAFGLRNEYRYTVVDGAGRIWIASRWQSTVNGPTEYMVYCRALSSELMPLHTTNEEEAAHYMASISDKWERE